MSQPITWILQPDTFGEHYRAFERAIDAAGHSRIEWMEEWADLDAAALRARLAVEGPAVFHGSLSAAHSVHSKSDLKPGAYCDEQAFRCSSWYPRAEPWLVHRAWVKCTAQELVDAPLEKAGHLLAPESRQVFVRPDSPLKHFSGRVVDLDSLTLESLDHGFYYDDAEIDVIVCPIEDIGREWRFVVVGGEVVAGCGYEASSRAATDVSDVPFDRAAHIARELAAPEDVYVLDLCESRGELRLMDLNPFSGADLYDCDPASVVSAVSGLL